MLHEDDVHYNIIVHKSHNVYKSVNNFKEHIKEDHREMTTIFGETNGKITSKSWAQVTKVCRPGYLDPHHEINTDAKIVSSEESQNLDCSTSDDLGWEKVGKRGKVNKVYNIPVHNKYDILQEADNNADSARNQTSFQCEECNIKISTKTMLKAHMKIHKTKAVPFKKCNCLMSKEYEKLQNEAKILRRELEQCKIKMKTLQDFSALKQHSVPPIIQLDAPKIQVENEQNSNVVIRESVITFCCKECPFTTKTSHNLSDHMKTHKEEMIMCKLCEVLFDSKGRLNQHMLNEHTERLKQLNCKYCSFQSTDRNESINHTSKHGERDNTVNIQIEQWKCRNCGIIYENKWSLMEHRKENHEMPFCRDDAKGGCDRGPAQCWYKHKNSQIQNEIKSNPSQCFSCQQAFTSLGNMMEHRKLVHPEIVKPCTKAASGECKRTKCWFLHENDNIEQGFQVLRESQEIP